MRIQSEPPTGELAIDLALARSVVYRTLSLGFHEPTAESLVPRVRNSVTDFLERGARLARRDDREYREYLREEQRRQTGCPARKMSANFELGTLAWLTSGAARQSLVAAAELVDSVSPDVEPILPAALGLAGALGAGLRDVAATSQRLFGHTARGLVCPLETEYGLDAAFQQPQALADIAGYYLAFGLRPQSRADYRVDHVGCECEFMDFLCRKEALFLQLGSDAQVAARDDDEETLDQTRHAARKFLRDHLGRFGRAFASRLAREANGGFFAALGDLLFSLVGSESARFGIPPGSIALELRSTAPDDMPMACGTGQELIQIQRRAPVEGR